MILSNKGITKALIRLRGCAGWSAPLLFANTEDRFLTLRLKYQMQPQNVYPNIFIQILMLCHNSTFLQNAYIMKTGTTSKLSVHNTLPLPNFVYWPMASLEQYDSIPDCPDMTECLLKAR